MLCGFFRCKTEGEQRAMAIVPVTLCCVQEVQSTQEGLVCHPRPGYRRYKKGISHRRASSRKGISHTGLVSYGFEVLYHVLY